MTVTDKKISIIIPCHNAADSLPACWQSLKDQTIGIDALEVIFVDDASDDAGVTWQLLEQFEKEAPDSVMIIRLEENMRQGGARNVALQYAGGTFLRFVDADDTIPADSCKRLYDLAQTHDADLIQFNHTIHYGIHSRSSEDCTETKLFQTVSPAEKKPFLLPVSVTYGCWNKLYRMTGVRAAEASFAEHMVYEEPPFVWPQFLYADRVLLLNEFHYDYRMHDNSTVAKVVGQRIPEHPAAQLCLLQWCLEHPFVMELYHDEIEFYFIWSYYCETVMFAENAHVALPDSMMSRMRDVCFRIFPDWKSNPYLNGRTEEELRYFSMLEAS